MISKLLKNHGIKKLLIIVGAIIAVVVLLRFIIGLTLLGKLFGFASDHLQHFEKEKTRIEKRLDNAEKSMNKAQEDVWTTVEGTHITQDLAQKTTQVGLDRHFEEYREKNRQEAETALENLRESTSSCEKDVLELIVTHAGNIYAGTQYKIDEAIALKRQFPELQVELAHFENLTRLSERESRRKNAIISYLDNIKSEDVNEDINYWLAKSRAAKPGCNRHYECKDNPMSSEYLKMLISAMEEYIKVGHFVSGEMRDGIYSTSHTRSVKEILNSARQAAGMPYEPMTKEERELALQTEMDILKKMKEDQAKKEREESANRRLG